MDTEQIQAAILKVEDRDELSRVFDAAKRRWSELTARLANEYQPGEQVRFEDKRGREVVGRVKRINTKTVTISPILTVDGNENHSYRQWRVAPSFLERVE